MKLSDHGGPSIMRWTLGGLLISGFVPRLACAETPSGALSARLEIVATGLSENVLTGTGAVDQLTPVDMSPLGDGRNLVLTLSGIVRMLNADGSPAHGPYLDTRNSHSYPPNGEFGPTSVQVHPGFLTPGSAGFGKFYTLTNERAGTAPADLGQGSHHQNAADVD